MRWVWLYGQTRPHYVQAGSAARLRHGSVYVRRPGYESVSGARAARGCARVPVPYDTSSPSSAAQTCWWPGLMRARRQELERLQRRAPEPAAASAPAPAAALADATTAHEPPPPHAAARSADASLADAGAARPGAGGGGHCAGAGSQACRVATMPCAAGAAPGTGPGRPVDRAPPTGPARPEGVCG